MASKYPIFLRSTHQLHELAARIISLGVLLGVYGLLFINMSVITGGVIIMMCGSCITVVSIQANHDVLED
jgi:hypothetical protein